MRELIGAVERHLGRRVGHREMGRLSGIPACCVRFYVNVWIPARFSMAAPARWTEHYESGGRGYVPCRACQLDGRRVLLRTDRAIVRMLKAGKLKAAKRTGR